MKNAGDSTLGLEDLFTYVRIVSVDTDAWCSPLWNEAAEKTMSREAHKGDVMIRVSACRRPIHGFLSDWIWLKATLPSTLGGLTIIMVSLPPYSYTSHLYNSAPQTVRDRFVTIIYNPVTVFHLIAIYKCMSVVMNIVLNGS